MTIINRVSLKSVEFGITPIDDVVDAPTIGTATAGVESATVAFTPKTTGGAATSFTAISTPGSITGSSATSPITVSGLTGGTAYTFQVYGTNASGTWSNVTSAASNSVTPTATAFDSIATYTGNGTTTTTTFSSIPGTYKALLIRYSYLPSQNGNLLAMRVNGNTASNYYLSGINGYSTTIRGLGNAGATSFQLDAYAYTAHKDYPSVGEMLIVDYSSTSKYKISNYTAGNVTTTTGDMTMGHAYWDVTSAFSSLTFFLPNGANFSSGTVIALYGVR